MSTAICWACDGATDEDVHTCVTRPAPFTIGLTAAAYLATIVAANAALDRYGLRSVGFGLVAPAGVYFAAIALTLRDLLREYAGRRIILLLIAVGAAASLLIEPTFAVASAAAFALSELLDSAAYEPLRRHGFVVAATVSGLVGLAVDSALFVYLADLPNAGGRTTLGLVVGKLYALAVSIAVLTPVARRVVPRHP